MPIARINGKQIHYTDTPPQPQSQSQSQSQPQSTTTPFLTIICVHGLGSTQSYYQPLLPHLTPHRVITFDNYGAGRSKYFPELLPETSIEAIAEDVLALIDYLRVEGSVVVVGYSMGGMVPSFLAADKKGRQRVRAGVCLGPVHPSDGVAGLFEKRIKTVRDGGMDTMANIIPDAATGPNTTSLQKAFIREMLLSQDPEGYAANCRAIMKAKPPKYADVQCPMLVVAGEVDKSAPVDGCRFIYESLGTTDKEFVVMQGVGHWYCVEDGDGVGKIVRTFLDKLS